MSHGLKPFRDVALGSRDVTVDHGDDGSVYVKLKQPLGPYPARMTDRLDHWAEVAPERTYLAQRVNSGEWRRLTYRQARDTARCIGQALVNRGLSAERPIVILSGNDLEHAMLALGAMYAGIPYAPLSPSYSLLSADFTKLRHIVDLLTPGLVFASSGPKFERAVESVIAPDAELVVTRDPVRSATLYSDLANTAPGPSLEKASQKVGPESIVKILFTSGSIAKPKGVINTHRMWCSNQEMIRTCWPFLAEEPPVLLEWLPWNHTFAGNKNMGLVLYNGGSMYLDDGKPVAGQFEETIRNLREIQPTIFLNVPVAFNALVPYLRKDRDLARNFFAHVRIMFYAGASLSQKTWEELEAMALETVGESILMLTGLGATETAPFALWAGKEAAQAGEVGLPAPGVTLKLVPSLGKLEARFKGPSITPGYWRQPELTEAAFDAEGFYKMGDALRYVEPGNEARGFLFDGRVAEDFKLSSATWVSVGPLRAAFLAHFAPFAREVVIAGRDRECVAALVFPELERCRAELWPQAPPSTGTAEIVHHPAVRCKFEELLQTFAAHSTGGSNRIARILLLDSPPSIDAHELTDKGSISQRAVLEHRAELVEELYTASPRVIHFQSNGE